MTSWQPVPAGQSAVVTITPQFPGDMVVYPFRLELPRAVASSFVIEQVGVGVQPVYGVGAPGYQKPRQPTPLAVLELAPVVMYQGMDFWVQVTALAPAVFNATMRAMLAGFVPSYT